MSGEHQIHKTDQAVQAFYCTCPKQNASHFSHQEPCHYSDTLYHYTLIYWNSCLTGVWILGTKWVFNGWISDLHRVCFSLGYMLKSMLNQGMNPWYYKSGILWMNFWPFHTLMVQYISCKWMNYESPTYEFPTIRVQYTSRKWITWEWFSNHRGTKYLT